jgi:hypothetical protein
LTAADRGIAEYIDVAGAFLRSSNWLQVTRTPGVLEAAIQAATRSNLAFFTSGQPTVGTATPSGAQYQSAQDVLLITMQSAPGVYVQVTVPAPKSTLFLAGGIQYDPADADWIVLLAAIQTSVTDINGNAALTLVSAVKSNRRPDQNG